MAEATWPAHPAGPHSGRERNEVTRLTRTRYHQLTSEASARLTVDRRWVMVAALALPLAGGAEAGPDGFAAETIASRLRTLAASENLRSGRRDERRIADRVASRLEAWGYTVHRQAVTVAARGVVEGELSSGQAVATIAVHDVAHREATRIEAPLALFDPGDDPAIVRDRIALVRLRPARHSRVEGPIREIASTVAAAGAKALVLITDGPTGETIHLNLPSEGSIVPVPLAALGPKRATALLAAARAGETGSFVAPAANEGPMTENVIGILDRGGPLLVLSTPRTAWTTAVGERGPGYAAFLALAEWACAQKGWSVLALNTGAHEFDNAGGLAFLSSKLAPAPSDVKLWVHLGAGFAARAHHEIGGYQLLPIDSVDPQRFLLGSKPLLPVLRDSFEGQAGLSTPYPISAGAVGELREIHAAGYERVFGLVGAHAYHHVRGDGLENTNPAWIRQASLAARDAIVQIMSEGG